jgi:CRP/FNR family transcriptional regulator
MNINHNNACDPEICFLCKYCLKEWIPSIEQFKTTFHLKKGEQLFTEGDEVKGIYFLKKGKLKVHKLWSGGRQMVIRFAKEGDVIGHRGLGSDTVYPVTATALEDITACFVERSFFLRSIQLNPDFALQLMIFYADELQDAEKRIRDLALMDVRGRIADTFLMLKKKFGVDDEGYIDVTLTRQDVASFAGTIYETFFKIATEFAEQKVIHYSGKRLKILKPSKLATYSKM